MTGILLLGLGALLLIGGRSGGSSTTTSPAPGPYYPPSDPYVPTPAGSPGGSQIDRLAVAFAKNGITDFYPEEFLTLRKWGRVVEAPVEYEPNIVNIAIFAQELRNRLGFPLAIKNGYRSPDYNAAVSGAKNSSHLRAAATDIEPLSVYGTSENDRRLEIEGAKMWLQYPDRLAGLGVYGGGRIHLDVFHPGGLGRRTWADKTASTVQAAKIELGMA